VSYILPTKIDFICDFINLAAFRFIQFVDCHIISLVTMRKLFYTYLFIKVFLKNIYGFYVYLLTVVYCGQTFLTFLMFQLCLCKKIGYF